MSVVEIPLDSEEPNIPENIPEKEIEEIAETEPEEKEIPQEEPAAEITESPPAPKRPRGRPKKEPKPKEAAAPPLPKKLKREPVQKKKPKPKRVVHYEPSSSDEELPEYVRQQVQPPAPQQDLATQMLKVFQNHENVRTARRQQLYSSWFRHW